MYQAGVCWRASADKGKGIMEAELQKETDIVELLARHEEAIAALYLKLAGKVKEYKEFWAGLSKEEVLHAKILRAVTKKLTGRRVTVDPKRFDRRAVINSMTYVNGLTGEVDGNKWNMRQALDVAFDIEKSMIDSRFFQVFQGDDLEMKNCLLELASGTHEHCLEIEKAMSRLRPDDKPLSDPRISQ